MKNLLVLLYFALILMSCEKVDLWGEDETNNRPPYIPIIDTIGTTLNPSVLKGTTWVIYKYKLEGVLGYQTISDTIRFISRDQYIYGTSPQKQNYSLYDYGTYYGLTMNYTRFGSQITCSNISKYALESGDIQAAKFKDNTIGSSGDVYYLFIKKNL